MNYHPEPIKVLFVEIALAVGGMERVLQNLVTSLDRSRIEPVIATLREKGTIAKELDKGNLRIYDRLLSRNYDPFGIGALARVAKREKVHIIYCANSPMAMIYSWLCMKLSCAKRFVVAFHTMGHVKRPLWRKFVLKATRNAVNRYIAVSNGQKDFFSKTYAIPSERIEVIYVGIDLTRFNPHFYDRSARDELNIPHSAQVVGILAVLRPEKRHEVFLRMAKSIISKRRDIFFLIVGDGPERERLENYTDELGISKHVRFTGSRSDVPKMLSAMDISVLCSGSGIETFPQALLESMAMELPIVSTNVGSIDEIVVDGSTGFLVPEDDDNAFTDRVLQLLDSPESARVMGKAGRSRVEELFSKEQMVRRFTELFEKIYADL